MRLMVVGNNVANATRGFYFLVRSKSTYFAPCIVKYNQSTCVRISIRLHVITQSTTSCFKNTLTCSPFNIAFLCILYFGICTNIMGSSMVFNRKYLSRHQLRRGLHPCTNCSQRSLGSRWFRTKLGNSHIHTRYPYPSTHSLLSPAASRDFFVDKTNDSFGSG